MLVWASMTTMLTTVLLLARPALARLCAARRSLDALPLDRVVVDLAACLLLVCAAWAWLAVSTTVVEAWRGVVPDHRPWHLPAVARRGVLAACGLAVASGVAVPASADDGAAPRHRHDGALVTGLPLPDRAVAPPPAPRPRSRRTVIVRTGDSLWSIAHRDLTPHAAAPAIVRRWHAIYATNRSLIGPDPDVIEPGQRLDLPPHHPPRKDRP
jgi:nucleoid-associated protein YgaU